MVAADHDGRGDFAARHHLVERQAEARALAQADPADARRQALEPDALGGHVEPVVQGRVVGDQLLDLGVGLVDVLRLSGQRDPAERPDAAAEQGPDVGRHEAGKVEGVLDAHLEGHLAQVVAVIEGRHALGLKLEHGAHVDRHGLLGGLNDRVGIAFLRALPAVERPAGRQVAVERVVRGGLIGDQVGLDPARDQLGQDLGGVAEQADRNRFALGGRLLDRLQRIIEIVGFLIEVAGLHAALDPGRPAFDGQHGGAGHGRGQRLRPAHAAQAAGQHPLAAEVPAVVPAPGLDEGLVGALDDPLGADVDPGAGGHLAVHHQPGTVEFVEVLPGRPVRHQVRVGDQHARRIGVGLEHADRLARLHQQGLVAVELL